MKILNKAQAEAVCAAMRALNNASMSGVQVIDACDWVKVACFHGRVVQVVNKWGQHESYPNQAAFAAAYGLQGAA